MGATKSDKHKARTALTLAALAFPGMKAQAGVPAAQTEGSVHYGYYQESGNRIRAEVYQGGFTTAVTDRLEFSFSMQRDTYSGATPAFSLPETMTSQPKYKQKADGTPASELSLVDVVSAASGGVTAAGLTILGGLNVYKSFVDARGPAETRFIANKPRPLSPAPPPTLAGSVTLGFQGLNFGAVLGAANVAPVAGGNCPGFGSLGCYYENGIAVGIVRDSSNPGAHLHRIGAATNRMLGYHADSSGVYIRALDGSAFSLNSLDFLAPLGPANPGTGPNDVWEILGYNTALNPNLDVSPNAPTQVAYQTVANGFNGTLVPNTTFNNINALWIRYKGYPQTPTDGKDFSVALDNVNLSGVTVNTAKTPEQIAWEKALDRYVGIAQYQAVIDSLVPSGTRTVQVYQPQPRETRSMPIFGARYYMDDSTIALSGGLSTEPDFQSSFGSINFVHELNEKHTSLSAGYSLTSNLIYRGGAGHASHHELDPDHNPTDYPELNETSLFQSFNLGISQVVSKNTVFQASASYTRQRGYLSNPYKFVYVRGEITAEEYYDLWQAGRGEVDWKSVTNLEVVGIELFRENRPSLRNLWTASAALQHYIPPIDASLHFGYRYYWDDWDIHSHTFELSLYQNLPSGFLLSPSIRYYSQSPAYFFAPYFLAPRADGFYSSDFRLAAFGAVSAGLTLSKRFTRGVTLEAGFECYKHASSLTLGGGGSGDYSDFDYYLIHAGLSLDLSAPGFASHAHGAHHGHSGGAVPAGVMFAHLMDRPGSLMVGYRYMFGYQSGDILHGSHTVTPQMIVDGACEYRKCSSRPTEMAMHMHMLNLMYAPTSWMNLMLMTQLVDMNMNLAQLPGVSEVEEDEHGGGHSSSGLGDTLVTASFRLFEHAGHRLHLGLGVSAPTGDVDLTLEGIDTPTSLLQDYGMQLGSGTWDFIPSLTYVGQNGNWSWGAQALGVKRLQDQNESGYALGDVFQASVWGGYQPFQWLTGTLRGTYTAQGGIRGEFNRPHATSAPVDFTSNYGGQFFDIGFGLNFTVPGGEFSGHSLGVEWLQPVVTAFNGFQLDRTGALYASWNYSF